MSLLRYFEGAKPGKRLKVNKIVSEDEKKNAKKDYEINKRERKFQVQWQDKRPWLSFNKAENNMFCISCRTEKVDSAFANGTNNFKIEAVKQHEASKSHLHYLQKFNTTSQSQPKTSLASQCLLQLKSNEYDSLKMKFINAHAVAKHHKSFKDFELLCRLDRKKGIDTSMNYNNDKSCSMFIKSIANVEKEGIVQKLTSAKFLSVTMDGSTDFTGEDLESVYIRSCTSGRVEDIFLHIGEAESACSGDLFDFLMNVFSTMGLTEAVNSKLVGFTADGASNMQGNKTGLATRLREKWPHLVTNHCLAHRLELAFKDSLKSTFKALYEKLMTLLLGLYYLYRKSPKQKKALKRSFKILNINQILPSRVGGTRWLPHVARAINGFIKGYRAIRLQLESASHNNAKAEGLAKLARDGSIISYMLILKDVVAQLVKFSLFLQKNGLTLGAAYMRVTATKAMFSQLIQKETDDIVKDVQVVMDTELYQGEEVKFKGHKFNPDELRKKFLTCVLKEMDVRFPIENPNTSIIKASLITCFSHWPIRGSDNISDFGDEEMNTVKKQFGAVLQAENVDTAQLSGEWSLLKAMVYERFGSDMNNVDLLDVNTAFQNNDVDNVLCVFDLLRSLPPTSVKNETCFSSMKLTKNKRRGRLNNSTLDTLMSVQLQSPSIEEFNPDAAIKDWLITPSGRKRKVCYSSKTKVPVTEDQPGTSHTEQPVPQVLGPLEPDEVEPAEDQSEQVVAVKPNSENYVQAATTALKAVRTAKQALIDSLLSGGDDDEDDDDDDNYTSDNDESDSEIPENLVDNMIFSFSRD
ncbi:zinc finger protein 862-like [Mytilus edulis]|uniref:zinc finger protein 862-like n=1 Tax=Mytilus edulis TaxID=6550 RepID=UPI0039EE6A1A